MSVVKSIIGGFEDIGKDVAREVANVPKDVVGSALESLGAGTGKQQQGKSNKPAPVKGGAVEKIEETSDEKLKKTIARRALQELSGKPQQQKEPSVWERMQKEEEEKKKMEQEQAKRNAMNQIPNIKGKRRRGDLYGIKGKIGTETSKNVRQD